MKIEDYIRFIICGFVGLLTLISCADDSTHPSFIEGTWLLDSIVINGQEDASYSGEWIWKFEEDVVEIDKINEVMHTREPHLGTWSIDDKVMTLLFNHSDNQYAPGEGPYAPPAEIYIVSPVTELKIDRSGSSRLILEGVESASGNIIEYRLRKQ